MVRISALLLPLFLLLTISPLARADEKGEVSPAARAAAKRELAEREAKFAGEVNAAI